MALLKVNLWCALFCVALQPGVRPAPAPAEPPELLPRPSVVYSLDKLPTPPGTVIVVIKDPKQAAEAMQVETIILSPDQWQAYMDRIDKLEKQAQPAKLPSVLGACILSGEVVGDYLKLEIKLAFKTNVENAIVPIGFKGVQFTKATLDGETPVWGPLADGYTIQVKEPRMYDTLVLETQLKVTSIGTDRKQITLDIPQAAITQLNLTVPGNVQSVSAKEVGGGAIRIEHPDATHSRLVGALGVLDRLDLTWQLAGKAETNRRLFINGDLRVAIDDDTAEAVARLRIEAQRGSFPSLQFRLGAPGAAVAVLEVETEPRSEGLGHSFNAPSQVLTVTFPEPLTPASGPVVLRVRTQKSHTAKPGEVVALGQIALQGVPGSAQRGTIAITPATDLSVQFEPKDANLSRIEPAELRLDPPESKAPTVAFRYWQQPVRLEARFMSLQTAQPIIEARTIHTLQWTENALLLASEFNLVRVPRTGIQELELDWPRGFTVKASPAEVESAELDSERPVVRVRLVNPRQGPFKIKLEGSLEIKPFDQRILSWPAASRAQVKKDFVAINVRDAEVRLTIPEDKDVSFTKEAAGFWLADGHPVEPGTPLRGEVHLGIVLGKPWELALAWQPRQYEVDNDVFVFLLPREMQVRQALTYHLVGPPPARIRLRVPRELDTGLEVHGVRLSDPPRRVDPHTVEITLPKDIGKVYTLMLEYRRPLPAQPPLAIPLASPIDARPGKGRARLWTASALQLHVDADSGWAPAALPALPGDMIAPSLELQRTQPDAPLQIGWQLSPETPFADLVADRALVDVRILPEGKLIYRVRFWLSRIRTDEIELILPAGSSAVLLHEVTLNAARHSPADAPRPEEAPRKPIEIVKETSESGQTILRIPVQPYLLYRPAVLEARFEWRPAADFAGGFVTVLPAVELAGRTTVGQVRWRVELPAEEGMFGRRLPLWHNAEYRAEGPWPQWFGDPKGNNVAAEMQEWLLQEKQGTGPAVNERPSLSYARVGALRALHVVHVPLQSWLLACSLAVLLGGIVWYCYATRFPLLWPVLAALSFVAVAVFLPSLVLPLTIGALPGLVVLGVVLTFLWARQQRWRRQVVMLPGFTRLSSGSSLVRTAPARPPGEPSTVDAPGPPPTSSSELRA